MEKDAPAEESDPSSFCEQSYAKEGAGARAFVSPPERPLPVSQPSVQAASATSGKAGWRWVNLWATWCRPCTEEMPLLGRWRDSLMKEGVNLSLELWSIDEDEGSLKEWLEQRPLPGQVRWLKDEEALGAALESFGVDAGSAIPIHVLVDPSEHVRCVRVGAVDEADFDAVKAVFTAG